MRWKLESNKPRSARATMQESALADRNGKRFSLKSLIPRAWRKKEIAAPDNGAFVIVGKSRPAHYMMTPEARRIADEYKRHYLEPGERVPRGPVVPRTLKSAAHNLRHWKQWEEEIAEMKRAVQEAGKIKAAPCEDAKKKIPFALLPMIEKPEMRLLPIRRNGVVKCLLPPHKITVREVGEALLSVLGQDRKIRGGASEAEVDAALSLYMKAPLGVQYSPDLYALEFLVIHAKNERFGPVVKRKRRTEKAQSA